MTHVAGRNIEAKFDNKGMIRFWGNLGVYVIFILIIIIIFKEPGNTSYSDF